jgi:ABC-type sugar transport system substrate-binding protein
MSCRVRSFVNRSKSTLAVALGALIVIVVLAGCGSSSSSSSSGSSGSSSASTASKGGLLCVSSLVGIAIVPELFETWKNTAEKNGMSYKQAIAEPEGSLNGAQANAASCIRAKAKVLVNITTEDKALPATISQQTKAGNYYVGQYSGEPVPNETLSIGPDNAGMSKQLFEYAQQHIEKTGKKPVVLLLTTSAFPVVVERIDTFSALAKKAGWKLVGPLEVAANNVAADSTSQTAAALRSNPDINAVLAYTDEVSAGASPAIKAAGKEAQILEYEGLEGTYSSMRAGNSLVSVVAGAPIRAYNELEISSVREMLAGKYKAGTKARCVGPVITKENVPAKGQLNPGGSCVVNGKSYSYEELKKLAEEA